MGNFCYNFLYSRHDIRNFSSKGAVFLTINQWDICKNNFHKKLFRKFLCLFLKKITCSLNFLNSHISTKNGQDKFANDIRTKKISNSNKYLLVYAVKTIFSKIACCVLLSCWILNFWNIPLDVRVKASFVIRHHCNVYKKPGWQKKIEKKALDVENINFTPSATVKILNVPYATKLKQELFEREIHKAPVLWAIEIHLDDLSYSRPTAVGSR